jgi:hypothetical protein
MSPSDDSGALKELKQLPRASTTAEGSGSDSLGAQAMSLRELRSRLNREDGGIGCKLTLDVLQTQFGRGLKEAAENLGMCATTLKRACRRLGVKRWPRSHAEALQVCFKVPLLSIFFGNFRFG